MTIEQQITELQDKATAASRACIKYMDSQNPQTKKIPCITEGSYGINNGD